VLALGPVLLEEAADLLAEGLVTLAVFEIHRSSRASARQGRVSEDDALLRENGKVEGAGRRAGLAQGGS